MVLSNYFGCAVVIILLNIARVHYANTQNVTEDGLGSENNTHDSNAIDELARKRVIASLECLQASQHKNDDGCQSFYDGIGCWRNAARNSVAKLKCIDVDMVSPSDLNAELKCLGNGSWENIPVEDSYKNCYLDRNKILNEVVLGMFKKIMAERNALQSEEIIQAYLNCAREVLYQPKLIDDGKSYCPRVFDGWGCWNDTHAGITAFRSCPEFIHIYDPSKTAYRICEPDGKWFIHPEGNTSWSNYTTCVDHEDLRFRENVNKIYVSGYSISLITLISSTAIFFYFRSLNCTRIKIHKHFFISFIVNNILWIIWYMHIVPDIDVLSKNEIWCKILHVVLHYFLLSNYMWMFCEGFYLHTILVITFVREELMVPVLYTIGWGIPSIFIIAYTSLRAKDEPSNLYCWIEKSKYNWVLVGPVVISLLLNLIFLINIVRLVVTKVRSVNSPENNHSRKAVRATIILIPLLGLNYILTPFRPETKSTGERIYDVVSAVSTSFQGLFVSLLLCFFNSEVMQVVQRKWKQKQLMYSGGHRMSYPNTTITLSANFDTRRSMRQLSENGPSPTEEYDI